VRPCKWRAEIFHALKKLSDELGMSGTAVGGMKGGFAADVRGQSNEAAIEF